MKVEAKLYRDARDDGMSEWFSRCYTAGDGLAMTEQRRLQSESDYTNGSYYRTSPDNGRTWGEWIPAEKGTAQVFGDHEREAPESDRSEINFVLDPVHGNYVGLAMDRVYKNGHEAAYRAFWSSGEVGFSDHTYLLVRRPDGTSFSQLVKYEEGDNFDPDDPVAPGYFDRNESYRGMNLVADENGDLILLVCPPVRKCCEIAGLDVESVFPSAPDIMHGVMAVRAEWDGEKYRFTPSRPVVISDRLSSRGVDEATVAKLASGRILIVFRGSNVRSENWHTRIEPGAPGFKWYCFSDDGGLTFSEPAPWRFDDGEAVYSSASISYLFRGEKNGKLYWIGNVTDHRVSGNFPRWPLCIARVDETWGTLKKDTLTVIDTVRPEESRQVQLSNFSFWQNRETGKLELFVTKIGQFPDETVWKSEVWHYTVTLE